MRLSPGHHDSIVTSLNGDPSYNARTTRRAVALLLSANSHAEGQLNIDQTVETPIGGGFGASAAGATSAVLAASAVSGIDLPKNELALYAHRAEIIEQTGLGSVSVIFDSVGAGVATVAGEPGKSKFVTVNTPDSLRIVTAFIGPFEKKDALSSATVSEKITRLGNIALTEFLADPTLENLGRQGERFSGALGFETPEIRKLIKVAKSAGALHASQNMIGYSIHGLVEETNVAKATSALRAYSADVRIDEFEVGSKKAGLF